MILLPGSRTRIEVHPSVLLNGIQSWGLPLGRSFAPDLRKDVARAS
jgi:hypothetical protein